MEFDAHCAVECEDIATVERLLRTWCRVNVRRNKSVLELAEETSNIRLMQLIDQFSATSELVAAAFACDADLVRASIRRSRFSGMFGKRREKVKVTFCIAYCYEKIIFQYAIVTDRAGVQPIGCRQGPRPRAQACG